MSAPPVKIMIIRHAEKPGDKKDRPPDGVGLSGAVDEDSLIVQGWQRAGALAALFAPHTGVFQSPELAQPNAIYASGTATSSSLRPQETITPLAAKLGVVPNTTFNASKKGGYPDEKDLVADVMKQSGVVLIAWQHQYILKIVGHLPLVPNTTLPPAWCGNRFDLVWVFDLVAGTEPLYTFTEVPQNLLAGDVDGPMEDPCP